MTKKEALTIGEVAAATGLTERALRHYENEGLLSPSRTAAGRRFYIAHDLARLAQVTAFKRAGFTVAQIRILLQGKADLARLVDAQLEALTAQKGDIETAVNLLSSVKAQFRVSASIDAPTLCALIRTGERTMENEQFGKVLNRYFTDEELAHWKERQDEMAKVDDFDQAAYGKAWEDLFARIGAALPLDPMSPEAAAFIAEWDKLLEPFMKVATPEMINGATRLWANADEWRDETKTPIPSGVWRFMDEARKAHGS